MADCAGYGIGVRFNLCVDGPVGNGKKANLSIYFANAGRNEYITGSPLVVNNWDGSELTVDVEPYMQYGYTSANCDLAATLKITPKAGTSGGTLLLEYVFTNCMAAGSSAPQVLENCGGPGPHVISEMSTFSLELGACPA